MGLLSALFGSAGIAYHLEQIDTQDATRDADRWDYGSFGEVKKAITEAMTDYACPDCGSRGVKGSGVVCRYGKVHLYKSESYKGWLGGWKTKTTFVKTVWRWHSWDVVGDGEIRCQSRGCRWRRTKDTKKKTCSKCRGAGRVVETCYVCGGKGESRCTYVSTHTNIWGYSNTNGKCEGGRFRVLGAWGNEGGFNGYCPECNGRGFNRCSSCNGDGRLDMGCGKCGGTGESF